MEKQINYLRDTSEVYLADLEKLVQDSSELYCFRYLIPYAGIRKKFNNFLSEYKKISTEETRQIKVQFYDLNCFIRGGKYKVAIILNGKIIYNSVFEKFIAATMPKDLENKYLEADVIIYSKELSYHFYTQETKKIRSNDKWIDIIFTLNELDNLYINSH